ncbi:uncharacterized protein LOC105026913 isoform X2 [Esox lucius]|uniref:Uncharacterized protein n=1 Tax=Esox lucius TaxID=8010 RepID=A0A3P8XJQ4_ESOLU|nr:uncharacterized protein LOC105026913 isoform X2 [Esox lucius]
MTDEETALETVEDPSESNVPRSAGPLVEVTFQRNPQQKLKFLESEPKALGITQIALGVFHVGCIIVMLTNGMGVLSREAFQIFGSHLVIIAGSLAIAAQNLRLTTLKACLGMQVVACAVSMFNLFFSMEAFSTYHIYSPCWHYEYNITTEICYSIVESSGHFIHTFALVNTAIIAISITLAIYCCKVVNCCFPAPRMPIITVQAPPVQ